MNTFERIQRIARLSLRLARTNFKLRNEGSYLGMFWYILHPLALFFILLFLRNIVSLGETAHYPAYLFLGISMFNLFSQATRTAAISLRKNRGFITSMQVEIEPFVLSPVIQAFFSHLFEILILSAILMSLNLPLFGLIPYVVLLAIFLVFVAGCSLLLATAGAYVTDATNVWSIFLNLLWFVTPIFYVIPATEFSWALKLNPLLPFLEGARTVILSQSSPNFSTMASMVVFAVAFFALGWAVFGRYKKTFAEIL